METESAGRPPAYARKARSRHRDCLYGSQSWHNFPFQRHWPYLAKLKDFSAAVSRESRQGKGLGAIAVSSGNPEGKAAG